MCLEYIKYITLISYWFITYKVSKYPTFCFTNFLWKQWLSSSRGTSLWISSQMYIKLKPLISSLLSNLHHEHISFCSKVIPINVLKNTCPGFKPSCDRRSRNITAVNIITNLTVRTNKVFRSRYIHLYCLSFYVY
jgi:hypothetical protein